MKMVVWAALIVSVLAFLVGVVGNLIELTGNATVILWPSLAWWRASVYCVLLAMALTMVHHHGPQKQ